VLALQCAVPIGSKQDHPVLSLRIQARKTARHND